jgi:hypothetical protein
VGERGAERDLDAALAALIEAALRRAAETDGVPPAEQARWVAQALAVGLRELVRAPLREALQAGYELGWRAAEDAHRRAASSQPGLATGSPPNSRAAVEPAGRESPAGGAQGSETADAPPPVHQVCVEVGPLPNFSAVNRFHAAVAGAPGVADTTMVAFRDGRLTLRVEHPDGTTLAAALRALDLGALRVLAAAPDRLELALEEPPPSAASRQQTGDGRGKPATHG